MIDRAGHSVGIGVRLPCRSGTGMVAPRQLSRRRLLALLAGAALAGGVGDDHTLARSSEGAKIVQEAKKHVGDRYVAGGTQPGGFDCSGFTYYVIKQALGRDISSDLIAQSRVGRKVSTSRRRKGDLIFFNTGAGGQVTHVAIVVSKNRVVHAMNPRDGVKTSNISSAYYRRNIHSVRRL